MGKEEYSKTGKIDPVQVKELQNTMLDLRDVTNLEPSLTDPSAIAQVKETADEFLDISFNLGALLSPVATTTPRVETETTTPSIDVEVLGKEFGKVKEALDKLDTSVDPASLVPFAPGIQKAKDKMDDIKEEYSKTGKIDPVQVKELQNTMLDLRDVTNLEPSLTDPSAIAQVKETADDFLDISFNLGALLSPVATTTPRVETETTTPSIDVEVLGKEFGKVKEALDKLDTSVDPASLLPFAPGIQKAKDKMDDIKEEYSKTGKIDPVQVK